MREMSVFAPGHTQQRSNTARMSTLILCACLALSVAMTGTPPDEEPAAAAGAAELVPFTLTLVHYQKGDPVGLFLAACTLAPIFAVCSYVTLLVALKFPPKLVFVFVGQLGNVALNVILKHLIRIPRPHGKAHLVDFGLYGVSATMEMLRELLLGLQLTPPSLFYSTNVLP